MLRMMPKAVSSLLLGLLLAGCASSPEPSAPGTSGADELVHTEAGRGDPRDPWESWNRQVFAFNETVDEWVLRPVAEGYQFVMPAFADRAVSNFFDNLSEVRNFINSVLQLKGEHAIVAAGRFTYNTVFGLGGLFDVATAFDLPERPEDFGQTLGYWGVSSGPYMMLPFIGPSSPRGAAGLATDGWVFPTLWDYAESPDRYYALALNVVDTRADLISAERFVSGDRYVFVRNAYLQRREFLINDGRVTSDPFTSGEDDDLMLDDF